MLTPLQLSGAVEARDSRVLAALDDESEAFHAAVDRVTEDMDASDVLAEACEFDDARLTKLMNAYRARHDSKENHAYYLWLLDNLFEDAAIRAAEGIARRREN